MASTYSNLKFQLMATGENSATWGNVTNVNMGTAIEEAIAGSADVAFSSANVTITLTDTNAAQTARNVRLNLTGTATAGYNLVVPAIEKPYIINNGTDGTITVKNATGTGIAVPTGKTIWVFNDGTNVKDVTTHLTSLTLGTFLPIASGGTGGNTAATARTALSAAVLGANSDITSLTGLTTALSVTQGGTGANTAALARTSLGTAASGANSDITSLSGLTTALSVAQGGTGSNTAALARTALGATTVGGNVFTLTNPSAITFPRFNADNTVSALDAATFRTAIGAGTSSTTGTVTSVATAGTVNGITLTGTVTSTGTLTLGGTLSGVSLTTQVTGTLPIANGGTNATTAAGALSSLGAYAATNPSGFTSNTGTVTSVATSGSTNGLSLTGGTITTTGTVTLSGSVTSVASGATIDSITIGYRSIPRSTTATTAAVGDVGKCIAVTANIAIPNSTFAAGDAVSIYNDSASAITITASITTLRQAGTTNTGNRTLAARGMATVWFNSSTEAIISGAGVT